MIWCMVDSGLLIYKKVNITDSIKEIEKFTMMMMPGVIQKHVMPHTLPKVMIPDVFESFNALLMVTANH